MIFFKNIYVNIVYLYKKYLNNIFFINNYLIYPYFIYLNFISSGTLVNENSFLYNNNSLYDIVTNIHLQSSSFMYNLFCIVNVNKYIYLKYIFNMFIFYHLYKKLYKYLHKNKYYYIDGFIDTYIFLKIKILNLFSKNKSFILKKVQLYTNLNKNYDVTKYFYKNNIKKINKLLIVDIYSLLNINFEDDINIRLKIYFKYNDKDYIIYFPYNNLYTMNLSERSLVDKELCSGEWCLYENTNNNSDNYYIPYPPYSIDIINNFRNDIIHPLYTTLFKKKYLYSLFNIESKDILSIEINNNNYNKLITYFEKIKTPFNDYGILYNTPVKLIWCLTENNIDINDFYRFYLKFESVYINEKTFELNDHFIEMTNIDLNKFIISERMKDIISERMKDTEKNRNFSVDSSLYYGANA